jgi:carboxyl-terminal processing protease
MKPWQKYLIGSLVVFVSAFGVFTAGFAIGNRTEGPSFIGGSQDDAQGRDLIDRVYDQIISTAVEPPSEDVLARGAVKGMVETLKKSEDPYALFYSPQAYSSFQELTTGRFSGIGVWLKVKGKKLEIVSVLPSTPALKAGLQRGDVIKTVDGEPVIAASTDEAVTLIKGPEGSEVDIEILRDGRRMDFSIERADIELPNLQSRLTADNLGYIQLLGFARRAGKQVKAEVSALLDRGAEGILLDLRDNGGGLFDEAIEVASVFIEDGDVVIYRDRASDDVVYKAEGDAFEDVPVVVLVNEGTASASEIVAGALQDQDRAVIVGMQTFGKGSVQDVIPLADSSALKLTTAAYLTPDGQSIDGTGIAPDVVVDFDPDSAGDLQFRRAVEVLEGIVLSSSNAQG